MAYRLPPNTGDFTGRRGTVTELTAILTADEHVPIAVVTGMGGVGKTALAVNVAHAMRWRFPCGRLYVDLRGMGEHPASSREVLGGLLRELGRPDVPYGLEERAALFRSELAGRRFLVLLDDARSPAQVRSLLPGACRRPARHRQDHTGSAGSRRLRWPRARGRTPPAGRAADGVDARRAGPQQSDAHPTTFRPAVVHHA